MKLTAKEYEMKRGKRPSAWARAMAEGKPATYAEWEWLSDPNGATLAEAVEWANTRRSNPVKIMLGGTYGKFNDMPEYEFTDEEKEMMLRILRSKIDDPHDDCSAWVTK